MKVFSMIMATMFILFAVLATIGCFCEWSGKCGTCNMEHEKGCNVTMRARLYSCFMTIVLWVCAATWVWLAWEDFADERNNTIENKIKYLKTDYQANMRLGYEKNQ